MIFFKSGRLDYAKPYYQHANPNSKDERFAAYFSGVIDEFHLCWTSKRNTITVRKPKKLDDRFFFYMNCHGFAFDSFWDYGYQVYMTSIPTLLEDDFIEMETPEPGDLVTFFDDKEMCIHTARVVNRDTMGQAMLIEKRGMIPFIRISRLADVIQSYTTKDYVPQTKFFREKLKQNIPPLAGFLDVMEKNNRLYQGFVERGGIRFASPVSL